MRKVCIYANFSYMCKTIFVCLFVAMQSRGCIEVCTENSRVELA